MPTLDSILSGVSSEPEKVAAQLSKLGNYATYYLETELKSMAAELTPLVKAELAAGYAASGLKTDSGDLYKASVEGVIVQTGVNGFRVLMQPGVMRKDGGNVYGQAGAYKFGGIKVSGGKRLTGTRRKTAKAGGLGGAVAIQARPGFYEIDLTAGGPISQRYIARIKIVLKRLGVIV